MENQECRIASLYMGNERMSDPGERGGKSGERSMRVQKEYFYAWSEERAL